MDQTEQVGTKARFLVENVGGISETAVELPPGVTVLTGRNATNRTSFLQSIAAAMGSRDVSLKGDAEEGSVELTMNGETYWRTLQAVDSGVKFGGEPYLDDPTVADLFAFLFESNEARRTVAQDRDLREVIMEPVDTAEIRAEIDRLQSRRQEIDDRIEELEARKAELPELEAEKRRLDDEIKSAREELATKETEIKEIDASVDETREEKAELDDRLDDLKSTRLQLERVRSDIDVQEESLRSLRGERADVEDELEAMDDPPAGGDDRLDEELAQLRERKGDLERRVSRLQDILQFNREMLDGDGPAVDGALSTGEASSNPTDQLVDDQIVCWTCGSEVERDRIDETLESLRSVRQEQLTEVREIEEEIETREEQKRSLQRRQRRRESLRSQRQEIEEEIERRESRLAELRERREELAAEVETLETEVEALEAESFSDVLDVHREANQLEFELEQLESERAETRERIEAIEAELEEEPKLRERREEIQTELESQRTRIDRIEQDAIEAFNRHMEEILDILAYEGLSRVWLERKEQTGREGRRTVEQSSFELHVVRTAESGSTYRDSVEHLSESEREVVGLTFALAGYLAHEAYETVPFMLLDSLEAIDAARIADLVTYFAEYTQYLVVALLPEDARALPAEYTRIEEI